MKIKCYDKYQKCHYIIDFTRDEDDIYIDSYSSKKGTAKIYINFLAVDSEDPQPKRWSDLEQFEIIE